jgi:hypothetical protein
MILGRKVRGGHEVPKVSLGPAMPYPTMYYGMATPGRAVRLFQGWLLTGQVARGHILLFWTPHTAGLCQLLTHCGRRRSPGCCRRCPARCSRRAAHHCSRAESRDQPPTTTRARTHAPSPPAPPPTPRGGVWKGVGGVKMVKGVKGMKGVKGVKGVKKVKVVKWVKGVKVVKGV